MSLLTQLAPQALLGTERKPPQLPSCHGQLGILLNDLASQPPEPQLLRAAGAIALAQPVVFAPGMSDVVLLPACPVELRPLADMPPLFNCLRMIFEQKQPLLMQQALRQLQQAGLLLPPSLLPLALNQAKDFAELLSQVVGERGFWLAKLNPTWAYLAGRQLDHSVWELGSFNERLGFIQQLRQQQPAQARDLIIAALPELDARDRLKLLETLQNQLSDQDIPELENLLRDRSKEVRSLVVNLLIQLPNSPLVQRLQQALAQLGNELTPPEVFNPDWKTDQIEAKRPQYESLGERAWWLYQLARGVPLCWWLQQRSAADWLVWIKKSDWSAALLRAWYEATLREGNAEWAHALLNTPKLAKAIQINEWDLINLLPDYEHYWRQQLEQGKSCGSLLAQIVQSRKAVSEAFAHAVFAQVQQQLSQERQSYDYALPAALQSFACLAPLTALSYANQHWAPSPAHAAYNADTLAQLQLIQQHRSTLNQYLARN